MWDIFFESLKVLDFLSLIISSMKKTVHFLVEFRSFNAAHWVLLVFFSDDVAVLCDCLRGDDVVSSDHANSDTGLLAGCDSSWDFSSDDILDTEDGNEGKVFLLEVLDFFVFW